MGRNLLTRLVDCQQEIFKLKTSQAMGEDTARTYTYTVSATATVRMLDGYRVLDWGSQTVYGESWREFRFVPIDGIFPLIQSTVRFLVDGSALVFSDYTRSLAGEIYSYASNGVGQCIRLLTSQGYRQTAFGEIGTPIPTTQQSSERGVALSIGLQGSSAGSPALTLPVGTVVTVEVTVIASQEGKIEIS